MTHQQQTAFENIVGKEAVSPFHTMFSTQSDNCTPFVHILDIIFFFSAELEEPNIGIGGKGLNMVGEKGPKWICQLIYIFSTGDRPGEG